MVHIICVQADVFSVGKMDFGVDDTGFEGFMNFLIKLKDGEYFRVGHVTWNWLVSYWNII